MPDTKKPRSNDSREYKDVKFKFCPGDSEEISQMMRGFCGGEGETFDCEKMMQIMQKMCCSTPVKSEKQ